MDVSTIITSTLKVAVRENGHLEPVFEDPRGLYISSVYSRYAVLHVKTFTVPPSCAPLRTSEAVGLLHSQNYLTARRYDLKIVRKWGNYELVVLDSRQRREVERFPVRCLRSPKTISCGKNQLNNLFMFTVEAHSFGNNSPASHELHIFKVLNCPAKELVDDLLRAGIQPNSNSPRHGNSTARQSVEAPRKQATMTYVYPSDQTVDLKPSARSTTVQEIKRNNSSDYHSQSSEDVTLTAAEQPVEPNIVARVINTDWLNAENILLNHCFDDVEENMERIREKVHKIASGLENHPGQDEAQPESCKKDCTLGQLVEQTVMDEEFRHVAEDFFQKLKFSLILLSRLSDHVNEPKAAVLVNQLFVLLSESVGYWRKSDTMSADFPRKIRQPLFPRYTIVFLEVNLIRGHEKLLHELGPAWNDSREDSPSLPVYIPTFKDGFQVIREQYEPTLFDYDKPGVDTRSEHRYMQPAKLSDFAKDMIRKKKKVAKVLGDYMSEGGKEGNKFSLNKDEYVEVIEDFGETCHICNESGQMGFCPSSLLTPLEVVRWRLHPKTMRTNFD